MRAVVKDKPQRGVTIAEVPDPEPDPGEVSVRVDTAGICGSDVHAFEWVPEYAWLEPHLPCVLGHELTGRIVDSNGDRSLVGQRVAIRPATTCGICESCLRGSSQRCSQRVRLGYERAGGLATHVVAPASNLYVLPDDLDQETASLIEPLTVAVHALDRVRFHLGASTAVVGVGAIGLLAAQVLLTRGAGEVVLVGTRSDEIGGGLDVGASLGATTYVAEDSSLDEKAKSCEVVLVAAGASAAVETAIRLARPGGQVVTVGLGIGQIAMDMDTAVRQELALIGSFGSVPSDWLDARQLVVSGRVVGGGIVSHHFDLDGTPEAFRLLETGQARKVCIHPNY